MISAPLSLRRRVQLELERRHLRYAASGSLLLSGTVFAIDLSVPLGVAIGALHCAAVLLTFWCRSVRITLAWTLLSSGLIVAGWLLRTPAVSPDQVLANRLISLALVWLCSAMVLSRLFASTRFRTAVEAAPAGMLLVNKKGRIVLANTAIGHIFGYSAEELCGGSLDQLVPPEHRAKHRALIERYFAEPSELVMGNRLEVCGLRADGTRVPVEISLRPIRTEVGCLALATVRDLTQDRQRDEQDQRLAAIVRSSRDAIFAIDLEGRITAWNPGAEAMFGYEANEIVGRGVDLLVPSELRGETENLRAAVRAGDVTDLQTVRVTKTGEPIDIDLMVSPIRNRYGRVVGASSISRDITSQRSSDRLLVELNTALVHAMPGIARVDAQGVIEEANEAVARMTGHSGASVTGLVWKKLVEPGARGSVEKAFQAMLREGRADVTVRYKVPEERFLELFLVRRLDSSSRFVGFHLFLRDVTRRARAEAQMRSLATNLEKANRRLQREAHIDPLTGLLNRRGLQRHLQRLRVNARRSGHTSMAVILVDVDDFKQVNDRFGHAAGDRALVAVAHRIEHTARVSDPVARIGGDEFLLILPGARIGAATRVAERMRAAIARKPVRTPAGEVPVTCSIGVSTVRSDRVSIESLIAAARRELAESKRGGKDRVTVSNRSSSDEARLRKLLEGHGLRALHQPIFDLLERRPIAFELLSRGPRGPYEQPKEFLGLVDPGEGLIRLDLACLRACAEAARVLPDWATLHFNVFPATLVEVGAERITRVLERAGPGRSLCIELSERDVSEVDELRSEILSLRELGIRIALDDVGTGHGSLDALVRLQPDVVKIDPAFVREAFARRDRSLERLLSITGVLHARTVVEGIEKEEMLRYLLGLQVRYGQGSLLGKVEPVAQGRVVQLQPKQPPRPADAGRTTRSS